VVARFAEEHGLDVEERHLGRRTVRLSGPARAMGRAFGIELTRVRHAGGVYHGYRGPLTLPADVGDRVVAALGLDGRPVARTHFIVFPGDVSAAASFTAPQVAKLYDFPSDADGTGTCIGVLEFGGGYRTADLQSAFTALGLAMPTVRSVSVDGAANSPTGDSSGPDGEVELDIEVTGALAPRSTIAVYFAPNTEQGFVDAVTTAAHDTTNQPWVLSISWGGPEASWSAQSQQALDAAFQDAAALGVTVCCASGDGGSADGDTDGQAHVDFPASSPHVIGCGGTHLSGTGSTITSETVWNSTGGASGGGVSSSFPPPSWQSGANVPVSVSGGGTGRGVPDVAGDADPSTGFQVTVDGSSLVIGGTSAVAPLWAGLLALIGQRNGSRLGFLNQTLYTTPAGAAAFHDITSGSNALSGAPGYSAGPGWDACTGLGSPDGTALERLLTSG
jgi:kumamolisin